MSQMKEQNKTPEKELNKMEKSNLSDAYFKTQVFIMLQELIGYVNSIKKTQAKMKVALSEIRKNLQKINSGWNGAKNQNNDLKHMEGKSIQSEQQDKKKKNKTKKTRIGLGTSGTSFNIPNPNHRSTRRRRGRARN